MRVVLEMLGLVPGRIGGMETYARNLARSLAALDGNHDYLAVLPTEARGLVRDEKGRVVEWIADRRVPAWGRRIRPIRTLLQSGALARQLRRWKYDVLHCTLMFPKPPWGGRNMVVTIPDLNFELLPDCWHPLDRRIMSLSARRAVRLADAVLTLSEFSKRTLIETYGVSADRVHVTPLGIRTDVFAPSRDPSDAATVRSELRLPATVLFFPANTWPHKNHVRLLEALVALRDVDGLRPSLVLTGAPERAHRNVMEAIACFGLGEQVRWLGYVDEPRLVALYRAATALVFPSLHEGFGAPILEAMACGCPVACSRTTAAGEVAGEAALTFNPADVADIARAIRALLHSDALRGDLARKGLARAAHFSWERTARDTLNVYDAVARRLRPRSTEPAERIA